MSYIHKCIHTYVHTLATRFRKQVCALLYILRIVTIVAWILCIAVAAAECSALASCPPNLVHLARHERLSRLRIRLQPRGWSPPVLRNQNGKGGRSMTIPPPSSLPLLYPSLFHPSLAPTSPPFVLSSSSSWSTSSSPSAALHSHSHICHFCS